MAGAKWRLRNRRFADIPIAITAPRANIVMKSAPLQMNQSLQPFRSDP
jgi:hypothetical protein